MTGSAKFVSESPNSANTIEITNIAKKTIINPTIAAVI